MTQNQPLNWTGLSRNMVTWHSSSDDLATQTFLVYKLIRGYTRGAGKETSNHTSSE